MKHLLLSSLLLTGLVSAQKSQDSVQFKAIAEHILVHGESYNDLKELTKGIGHRLSGSSAYEKAVVWGEKKLRQAGADKVYLQPVMVPVWVRGKESLKIRTNGGHWEEIEMLSLGNSEGTRGKDLKAELIMVSSEKEFQMLPADKVRGKFIFFNFPWGHHHVEPFKAYGEAGKYRRSAASWAAAKGGVGVVIRSLSSAFDDEPHTGSLRYEEELKKVPAVAIGNESADRLARLLEKQKLEVLLNSEATNKGELLSYNVIGEITGHKDSKVIVAAGHLDSWDVGEGAHDDGSGVVQSIEVLRTFKELGIKNNHTIRVILYANEENGVRGGYAYLDAVKKSKEPHLFAMESDSGGFTPRGIAMDMEEEKIRQITSWEDLFRPYGIHDFQRRHSGVDIGPLKSLGIPLSGLFPDPQRYFDIHHTHEDTLEKVNRRELLLGASAMTQLIFMIDKYW